MAIASLLAVSGALGSACITPSWVGDKQLIEEFRSRGIPMLISWISPGRPNSAGGVSASVTFWNSSEKVYKYVEFEVEPYNAVFDQVASSIGGKRLAILESTGPYAYGEGNPLSYWSNVWYNNTIRCIQLTKVKVTFMDGAEFVADSPEEIGRLLAPDVSNSCSAPSSG